MRVVLRRATRAPWVDPRAHRLLWLACNSKWAMNDLVEQQPHQGCVLSVDAVALPIVASADDLAAMVHRPRAADTGA